MRFRDPVCDMTVTWEEARDFEVLDYGIVYFCCAGCAGRFREEPPRAAATPRHWTERRHDCTNVSGSMRSNSASGFVDQAAVVDFRPLEQVPRIGGVPIDTLEQSVAAEWRRQLGYAADTRCVCRTMERALLRLALDERVRGQPREVELILAAEVARVRMNLLDRDRVSSELPRLPAALRTALSRTDLSPLQLERTISRVTREIPSIIRSMEYRVPDPRARWPQTAPMAPGNQAARSQAPSHCSGGSQPQRRDS